MSREGILCCRCCCCGASLTTVTLSTIVVELILLSHCIVFTATNFAAGFDKYTSTNLQYSSVVPFEYLLPFLIIQALWFSSCFLGAVGIKLRWPHLLIPYILLTAIALFTVLFLLAVAVLRLIRGGTGGAEVSWPLILTITLATAFLLVEGYLIMVKYLCLRYLIRKRKAVVASDKSPGGGKVMVNDDDAFDTYSRRSTVIISDDMIPPPVYEYS